MNALSSPFSKRKRTLNKRSYKFLRLATSVGETKPGKRLRLLGQMFAVMRSDKPLTRKQCIRRIRLHQRRLAQIVREETARAFQAGVDAGHIPTADSIFDSVLQRTLVPTVVDMTIRKGLLNHHA